MAGTESHHERRDLLASLLQDGADGDLDGRLLRTREVALLFRVSERAVTEWARRGRISSVRTPGGHRRYPATEVRTLLLASGQGATPDGDRESGGKSPA